MPQGNVLDVDEDFFAALAVPDLPAGVAGLWRIARTAGVIGRVEDMHRILDAETAGTLAYLEVLTKTRGCGAGPRPAPPRRGWCMR